MIDRRVKILFSSRSESNLVTELYLINYIQQYRNGNLEQVDSKLLAEQVKYVYETEPNINDYREEQIGETFNIKKYGDQSLLLELIYFLVGEKHNNDTEPISLEKLDKWGDCVMQHGFYLGYELKEEDTSRLLNELRPDYIFRNSRDMDLRGQEWEYLCKNEFNEQLSEDVIISHINLYNDGAYTTLPESVDTILYYINKNQDFGHWLELYKLLTYVPLQGRLMYSIKTIEDCLAIIKEESKHNVNHRKVFAYLMRKRIFDLFIQEQDFLERNADNEDLDKEEKSLGALILKEWNDSKREFAQQIVTTHWHNLFNADEIIVWLDAKHSQMQSMRGIYKKRYCDTLQLIEEITFNTYNFKGITTEDKKLSALLYFISHIEIQDKEQCKQIIYSICKKIYTEEHLYLPWRFDEDSLNVMRAAYTCLANSEINGKALAQPYVSQIDLEDKSSRIHQGNKWWLSILMLHTEESESCDEFMDNAEMLLDCAKKCNFLLHENYLLPFIIAEIIVVEIIKEGKDIFEQRLIKEIDDIIFVISILTNNNGIMSEENKILLKRNIQEKWEDAKKQASFNRNIETCEEYMRNNELK